MTLHARTGLIGGTFLLGLGLWLAASATGLRALAEPGQAPASSEKDKAGWKSLFDGKSLAGWKSVDFGNEGKVSVKDGAVVMEKGNEMTGIVYVPGDFPKMDYEVTLEAKKLAGNDFFCTTTFPVGDSFCSFVVGGWGGSVVGLSSVDGADASENETGQAKEFKQDQWYRVRIRVTKKIEAWIDGEKLIDLDTTERKISIRARVPAVSSVRHLHLGHGRRRPRHSRSHPGTLGQAEVTGGERRGVSPPVLRPRSSILDPRSSILDPRSSIPYGSSLM